MDNRSSADSVVLTAEGKGWHKGLRKGRKEGLREGLEKGLQKGRQEAIAEAVKKMHSAGFTVAQIAKGLGLPARRTAASGARRLGTA